MKKPEEKNTLYRSLLDPKSEYLKKFRELAPGSYKHCENVASFCESVSLELGLDEDLMKVAARFHDIGKINYPEAFSENQNGSNIHDNLDPSVSYNIITKHVGDTILYLLQIEDMPREVLKIISQHHGNTVLKFFYEKSGSNIEDIYRYKCLSPQSIEAAVLMLCDSVEATARALANNGKLNDSKDRKSVVDLTVRRLMEDSQLDDMKVGELKIVKKVLYKELENVYHKRELYGEEEDEKKIKELDEEEIC